MIEGVAIGPDDDDSMSPEELNTTFNQWNYSKRSIIYNDNDLSYLPSTAEWDNYEERMPEDVAQAAIEKLNAWVYEKVR